MRRAWLCGEDQGSGRSYEHRRQWVEDSIAELAEVFAVAVWGYAVISNDLHVVVEVIPQVAAAWSADEVAARWCRLYPRQNQDANARAKVLAGNAERIEVLRGRLGDLSWFMPASRADCPSGQSRRRLQGTFLGSAVQVPGTA